MKLQHIKTELKRIAARTISDSVAPIYADSLLRRLESHDVSLAMCESFIGRVKQEYPDFYATD